MSDLGDPTGWTDREREFFAAGWNECVKMQPGENDRLRAALQKIAGDKAHHRGWAMRKVAQVALNNQQIQADK